MKLQYGDTAQSFCGALGNRSVSGVTSLSMLKHSLIMPQIVGFDWLPWQWKKTIAVFATLCDGCPEA